MIDDDHFMRSWIGLNKGTRKVSDEAGGFVAGANDDTDGVLLGLLFGWESIEGQPSEEPQIVNYLHEGDQAKNNKQQFEPGEAQIRFSHKRYTKVQI